MPIEVRYGSGANAMAAILAAEQQRSASGGGGGGGRGGGGIQEYGGGGPPPPPPQFRTIGGGGGGPVNPYELAAFQHSLQAERDDRLNRLGVEQEERADARFYERAENQNTYQTERDTRLYGQQQERDTANYDNQRYQYALANGIFTEADDRTLQGLEAQQAQIDATDGPDEVRRQATARIYPQLAALQALRESARTRRVREGYQRQMSDMNNRMFTLADPDNNGEQAHDASGMPMVYGPGHIMEGQPVPNRGSLRILNEHGIPVPVRDGPQIPIAEFNAMWQAIAVNNPQATPEQIIERLNPMVQAWHQMNGIRGTATQANFGGGFGAANPPPVGPGAGPPQTNPANRQMTEAQLADRYTGYANTVRAALQEPGLTPQRVQQLQRSLSGHENMQQRYSSLSQIDAVLSRAMTFPVGSPERGEVAALQELQRTLRDQQASRQSVQGFVTALSPATQRAIGWLPPQQDPYDGSDFGARIEGYGIPAPQPGQVQPVSGQAAQPGNPQVQPRTVANVLDALTQIPQRVDERREFTPNGWRTVPGNNTPQNLHATLMPILQTAARSGETELSGPQRARYDNAIAALPPHLQQELELPRSREAMFADSLSRRIDSAMQGPGMYIDGGRLAEMQTILRTAYRENRELSRNERQTYERLRSNMYTSQVRELLRYDPRVGSVTEEEAAPAPAEPDLLRQPPPYNQPVDDQERERIRQMIQRLQQPR